MAGKIKVMKIDQLNTIVIKQEGGQDFFISAPNAIIISVSSLSFLLKFLTENDYISVKVLEGIIQEVRSQQEMERII
jgi:hypothetical protein